MHVCEKTYNKSIYWNFAMEDQSVEQIKIDFYQNNQKTFGHNNQNKVRAYLINVLDFQPLNNLVPKQQDLWLIKMVLEMLQWRKLLLFSMIKVNHGSRKARIKVALMCDNVHEAIVTTPMPHFHLHLPLRVKYKVEEAEYIAVILYLLLLVGSIGLEYASK